MVLRLHFTADDLARVRLAAAPALLTEMAFSIQVLRKPAPSMCWDRWRQHARSVPGPFPVLRRLIPPDGPWPAFLTPPTRGSTVEPVLEIMRATPRAHLRADVATVSRSRSLPPWSRSLADGNPEIMDQLVGEARTYLTTALSPYWTKIRAQCDADHHHRVATLAEHGVAGLLASLQPSLRWESTVLHLPGADADLHLNGRGLLLAPSFFYRGHPTPLPNRDTPTLVYSIHSDATTHRTIFGHDSDPTTHLAELLGPTRAAILTAIASTPGTSTSGLAAQLDITLGSVSKHTTVLRNNHLITTTRDRHRVHHTPTTLGLHLLHDKEERLTLPSS